MTHHELVNVQPMPMQHGDRPGTVLRAECSCGDWAAITDRLLEDYAYHIKFVNEKGL